MGDEFNLERYRMPDTQEQAVLTKRSTQPGNRMPSHIRGAFIRPCPVAWIGPAVELPGKACAVALACWYAAGKAKTKSVQITPKIRNEMRLEPKSFRLGLARIEAAGLVDVQRHRGRSPTITILLPEEAAKRPPQ